MRRKAGTEYLGPQRMDRNKFNALIVLVLKAILDKVPSSMNIRIIADGAGSHSVGKHRQRGLNNALKDVRKWIE